VIRILNKKKACTCFFDRSNDSNSSGTIHCGGWWT